MTSLGRTRLPLMIGIHVGAVRARGRTMTCVSSAVASASAARPTMWSDPHPGGVEVVEQLAIDAERDARCPEQPRQAVGQRGDDGDPGDCVDPATLAPRGLALHRGHAVTAFRRPSACK